MQIMEIAEVIANATDAACGGISADAEVFPQEDSTVRFEITDDETGQAYVVTVEASPIVRGPVAARSYASVAC